MLSFYGRSAIEEELEVLYDAYYEELELYANQQQQYVNSPHTTQPPPGPGPFPGSVEFDQNGAVIPNDLTKHPAPPTLPAEIEYDDEEDDYDFSGPERPAFSMPGSPRFRAGMATPGDMGTLTEEVSYYDDSWGGSFTDFLPILLSRCRD